MTEHQFNQDFEQAWESIRQDKAPPDGLDPGLIEALRAIHARDDVPPLDPEFVQELREELVTASTPFMNPPDALPFSPNGRKDATPWINRWPAEPRTPRSRGRELGHLATAALVLLSLIGGMIAVGLQQSNWFARNPATLPAINGAPAIAEGVTIDTLLDTTTGALPPGPGIIIFKRLTFQPSTKPLVVLPLTGPVFLLVQSGDLTVTEAGKTHALAAGDQFSPLAPNQELEVRSMGAEEAVALLVYLQNGPDLPFPRDSAVHTVEVLISHDTEPGIDCPCRIQLDRITITPGSTLPDLVANPRAWFIVDSGIVGLTLEGEQLPYQFKPGQERVFRYGQYLPIDLVEPGTTMALRNAGDDPLILYRLTFTPGEGEAPAAAAPAENT